MGESMFLLEARESIRGSDDFSDMHLQAPGNTFKACILLAQQLEDDTLPASHYPPHISISLD